MHNNKPILLVEDDKVDALTVKRAFKDLNIPNNLVFAYNGEEALEYLLDSEKVNPCLILLDINMPKMNGIEFLKEFKKHESINYIPVIVVTTSRDEEDKIELFNLSVSGYMIKSLEYNKFLRTIEVIKSYWTLSELPAHK